MYKFAQRPAHRSPLSSHTFFLRAAQQMFFGPRLIGALILISLTGCDGWDDWRRESAIAAEISILGDTLATLSLPKIKSAAGGISKDYLQLAVGPQQVALSNGAWLGHQNARGTPQLANLTGSTIEPYLVSWQATWDNLGGIAPALIEKIEIARRVETEIRGQSSDGLELFIHKDLPFKKVSKLLTVLEKTQLSTFRFASDIEKIPHFTEIKTGIGECEASDDTDAKKACAWADIGWTSGGLQVVAHHGKVHSRLCTPSTPKAQPEPNNQPSKSTPIWAARVMKGQKNACPSVPYINKSTLNTHALTALLKDLHELAPGCTTAKVSIPAHIPWHEAFVALTTLRYHSPYTNPTLALADESKAKPSCLKGLQPSKDLSVSKKRQGSQRKVNRLSVMGILED
jgi:hypothetical protein